ncbi:LOW QUALITY PROTEIN: hypothetical protein BRADI_4g21520v3 [Brachypodium distachyon]|uniref:DUF642 domain-containing protein n=1 Tax=Brachypodium distachyon TaxID=15368 RepID=A0A2K2CP72_BRADI|nr:LOW QUALITY PROTEIN: hypothetical protein BRADI_4g21520v3 [Brachypodium distachyon]
MAMNQLFLLLLVAAASIVASSATNTTSNSTAPSPTAYEMLGKYGFPPGILPQGVRHYVLHPDGSFNVSLPGDCEIKVAGYTLRSIIHGNIKSLLISELDGLSFKLVIQSVGGNLGVSEVKREGDDLRFQAGVVSKSFPFSDFAVSRRCN